TGSKPWLVAGSIAAVVAVVAGIGFAVFGGSDRTEPAPTTAATPTASPTPSLNSPPPLNGLPGSFPTIATYLHDVNPNLVMTHRHDPGAPIITLPMPEHWVDAGTTTRSFAYQTIVYRGPTTVSYVPSVTALISKLGPGVEPQKIIDFAPGELNNLPGFAAIDRGQMRTIDGRQAFRLSGTWNAPVVPATPGTAGAPDVPEVPAMQRLIAQYTVVIEDHATLYVLQINVDAAAGQNAIFQQICDAIDQDTKIAIG
ncbi:MAG: LpqN/LpqT family lipoprotein, partial [Mycobacterium sp.]